MSASRGGTSCGEEPEGLVHLAIHDAGRLLRAIEPHLPVIREPLHVARLAVRLLDRDIGPHRALNPLLAVRVHEGLERATDTPRLDGANAFRPDNCKTP